MLISDVSKNLITAFNASKEVLSFTAPEDLGWVELEIDVEVHGAIFAEINIYVDNAAIKKRTGHGYDVTTATRIAFGLTHSVRLKKGQSLKVTSYYITPSSAPATAAFSRSKIFSRGPLSGYLDTLEGTVTPGLFNVLSATDTSASGVSNGVGFSYTGQNMLSSTTTDGGFQNFSAGTAYHLPNSDRLHIWGAGAFEFTSPVKGVYLYMMWDPSLPQEPDLIDFGYPTAVVYGDILQVGNAVGANSASGGIVYIPLNGGTTMSFTSPIVPGINDNCTDIALIAIPAT